MIFIKELNFTYDKINKTGYQKEWADMIGMLYSYLKHIKNFIATSSMTNSFKIEKYFEMYTRMIFQPKNLTAGTYSQDGNKKMINYISNFGILTHVGVVTVSSETEDKEEKIVTHFIKTEGEYIK